MPTLTIWLTSLCVIAYSIGFYIRNSVLYKIKANDIQTYKQILGDHPESGIESGWESPSDMSAHCGLHKYISSHGINYLSRPAWITYRISVWFTVISFVVVCPIAISTLI